MRISDWSSDVCSSDLNRTALHHARLSEAIDSASSTAGAALHRLQALGMDPQQALAAVNRMIDQQAATLAANELFRLSAWLFVVLIPVIWLARPERNAAGAEAVGAH